MKYIKKFEIKVFNNEDIDILSTKEKEKLKKCKFKLGDYVKFKQVNWIKGSLIIRGINISKNLNYYSLFDLIDDNFICWSGEDNLIALTPKEVKDIETKLNVNKYNL